jgi:hypothetical protein
MLKRTIVLAIFLMVSAGCGSTSVYVLDKEELIRVKAGSVVTAKFDGWVLSDRAVTRVMNAKIKDANLK